MMNWKSVILTALVLPTLAAAKETSEKVTLKVGSQTLRDEVFFDAGTKGKHPGILLLPEWWGVTPLERENARRLASQGYVVLVADLYGDGFTTMDTEKADARLNETQSNMDQLDAVFRKAFETLASRSDVDKTKLAVVGFGFGGAVAINQARHGLDARAVVDFFGGLNPLDPKDLAKTVTPELLILVGEYDAYVTERQFKPFRQEMKKAEARFTIEILPKVFHDFIRPGVNEISEKSKIVMQYDPKATAKAWELTDRFLSRKLKE